MKKCILGCLLAVLMVSTAMAGEDPYIAVVGNDIAANPFYLSPKYVQFMYDQNALSIPDVFTDYGIVPAKTTQTRVGVAGGEMFRANKPINQIEVCYTEPGTNPGNPNAVALKGAESVFEWYIRLPKAPSGQLNLVLQCGILKPNALAGFEADDKYLAVGVCAAETGEKIDTGFCQRQTLEPGVNPLTIAGLPKITAIAYPGPYAYNNWLPFNLTAFKNPSSYSVAFDAVTGAMSNGAAAQVLDGSANTRVLLKSCMDESIIVKIPVTGQLNSLGQAESDLIEGDLIYIKMYVPKQNTVDIYCHAQSAKVMGIGVEP